MSREQRHYISYLLRLWQTRSGGELIWRASLESPHTRERRGFASLMDMFTFLEKEISSIGEGKAAPNAGEKRDDAHK
jgi:hypothetical protein